MYIYKLKKNGILELNGAFFPQNPSNRDYVQYLKRLEQGVAEVVQEISNVTMEQIRTKRNQLLKESDSFMISDYPRKSRTLLEIQEYRQSLRDFTKTVSLDGIEKIEDVVFPNIKF